LCLRVFFLFGCHCSNTRFLLFRINKKMDMTSTGQKPPPASSVAAVSKSLDNELANLVSTGNIIGATVHVASQKPPSLSNAQNDKIEKLHALIP
jgi:hypothetical protein